MLIIPLLDAAWMLLLCCSMFKLCIRPELDALLLCNNSGLTSSVLWELVLYKVKSGTVVKRWKLVDTTKKRYRYLSARYKAKIHILHQKSHFENFSQNLHFWNLIFHKIHIFKVWFFTKFTFSKSDFSQNSHFQNFNFHKIHIFKIAIFTKFTFLKSNIWQNSHLWTLFLQNAHFFNHQIPVNFWG